MTLLKKIKLNRSVLHSGALLNCVVEFLLQYRNNHKQKEG